MFAIIILGSLPRVILLNRVDQYESRYWRWNESVELEECIKDAFEDSLKNYTQSDEYTKEKQSADEKLAAFRNGLSDIQKQQFNEMMDTVTTVSSMLASEAYLHGVVEGIALKSRIIG